MKFKSIHKQLKLPFVFYCDFETCPVEINEQRGKSMAPDVLLLILFMSKVVYFNPLNPQV